jgi:hypothetical protein
VVDVDANKSRAPWDWRALALLLVFGTAIRCWIVAEDAVDVGLAAFWSVLLAVLGLRARAEVAREREALRWG